MTIFTKTANDVFAPVDSGGNARQIVPHDAQVWGTEVERISLGVSAGATIYDSKADMDADTSQAANAMAWVFDSDPDLAGIYQFDGTAIWTRLGDLPYSYIKATNAGAGTANAIQATTSVPVPAADGGALIALPIVADNTASPVTVSFNGGSALTVKTSSGNDIAVGGLTAGMIVAGYVSGSAFRLLSDQASAAVLPQMEALLEQFKKGYLGAYVDDTAATAAAGGAPSEGAEYWNTTEDERRTWDGSAWVVGEISAAMINTHLPSLIGDIDLINPVFGAVRTGAPGTETANNTAFANAINEAKEQAAVHSQSAALVDLPSGVFRVNEPIALDVDCARVVLRGKGASATRIITSESEIDLLSVDGGVGSGLNDFGIAGIKFAYVGLEVDRTASANKKNEPSLVRLKNVLNLRLYDLEFEGGYNDLILHRVAHLKAAVLQHWKRATNYPAGYGMVATSDATMAGGCTNWEISHVDVENRNALPGGCEAAWLIETADGLLANNVHLIQCINDVQISPVGTANRDKVGGVFFTNFYADTCTQDAISILGSASNYGRINLISGYARNAGRDGVRVGAGTTIDGLTILPTFKVHSNENWGVNCANANIKNHKIDADFKDNNGANSASYGDINVSGTDYDIGGTYVGGGANGTAIKLASGAGIGWVRGHNLDGSTAGTKISDGSTGGKINATRVYSGTYTPTLTNATNVSSSSASTFQYSRVDDILTVSGRVSITPSASGLVTLGISLPLDPSANFSESGQAGGAGVATSSNGVTGGVRAKTGAKIVELSGANTITAAHSVQISFQYRLGS